MTTTVPKAEPQLSTETVLERVRALLPGIRERAEEAERERTIPKESAQEFVDAGLPRILTPKRFGGAELGLRAWMDVVLEISAADAAHGWCASLLIHHPHYIGQFPEPAQAAVWADGPDVPIAGTFTPGSEITPVNDGFRISGKISYLSGVNHCTWIFVGGMLPQPDGKPSWTLFPVPPGQYEVLDTWHTIGMRGTGSNTVVYKDVFVPADQIVAVDAMRAGAAPGAKINDAPFFHAPWSTYAPFTFLAPMLGAARGALEDYRVWTSARASLFAGPVAQFTSIQTRYSRAAATLDAAELMIYRAIDIAEQRDPASPGLRARTYRDAARVSELILEAMDIIMQISGSAGFATSSRIQRAWRDVHFASSHVSLNPENNYVGWGRQEFGIEQDPDQRLY